MYMYGDSVNLITVETEMSMLSFNAVRFLTEQNHSSEEHAERPWHECPYTDLTGSPTLCMTSTALL